MSIRPCTITGIVMMLVGYKIFSNQSIYNFVYNITFDFKGYSTPLGLGLIFIGAVLVLIGISVGSD